MSFKGIFNWNSNSRRAFFMVRTAVLCIAAIYSNDIHAQQKIFSCPDVAVSDVLTTHLIFGEPIKYLDVGSPYFIADTVNKIVKVRHTGKLPEYEKSSYCNITVITNKGLFYSIPVSYTPRPDVLVFKYGADEKNGCVYKGLTEADMDTEPMPQVPDVCELAHAIKPNAQIRKRRDNLLVHVDNVYYHEPQMVFKITIENLSAIDFEIDQALFRIKRNKLPRKLYSYQEKTLQAVNTCNAATVVKGKSKESFVFVFDRFTPAYNEYLNITFAEKSGGRSIFVKVSRDKLLNPTKL